MKILLTIIIGLIIFVAYVRFLEKTSIYYPVRTLIIDPAEISLQYEDVYFDTEDHIRINGWLVKSNNAKGTLLFFHGNAGNIGDRLGKIHLFHQLGLNVFIIDYRGYGRSDGAPSEKGLYKDAVAAYDYLLTRKDIDTKKVIGYGVSLGGAVAVDMASKRELYALILDSTFSNAKDMAKRIFPLVPSFLIQSDMDSVRKIKNVRCPKLFIHSHEDRTVPIEFAKKLYKAAPEPKEFLEISGDHNDNIDKDYDRFVNGINEFINSLK